MKKQKGILISKQPESPEQIKSDFITVASHQLRTPISAIRWSLDTLLNSQTGELSEKQKEIISEAYQNNNFMVKVVNDLLRVSRIEEKGVNLLPKTINLTDLIKKAIKKYEPLARASNCSVKLLVNTEPTKAYTDPLQIKVVIDALLDNAIRYTKGKGEIEITINKIRDYLLLKFKDNGIGIPADQQKLVFSKFFRAKNAVKTQTGGLGLNLYLVKQIIEASGGKIDFISKENQGSTFNIYLPLAQSQLVKLLPTKEEGEESAEDILKKEREFVSITVHELKAPLGITKWSLEMLKNQKTGKLNSDQLELIEQVYRGNERLLVLVRDLLNLAKLQEGKFEIEPKEINLKEIISDVINTFKVEAERKKIKIESEGLTNSIPKVIADTNRITQVITNLVSNAIKYTPSGGKVTILIKKMAAEELKNINRQTKTANLSYVNNKNGYLVFAIKDTGIGISEQDQNKLFTKFFRSKKVLDSKTEGTGLGLYITKSIVNLHKGDIWFTSQVGAGSTFYFSLPIA